MNAAREEVAKTAADTDAGAGIRALMRAVLQDAILCLGGYVGPAREQAQLAAEALRWVTSKDGRWPFAFETLCDTLGVDAGYLRRRLLCDVLRPPTRGGRSARGTADMMRMVRRLRLRGNQTVRELKGSGARRRSARLRSASLAPGAMTG
jgi:hypothetical protein